jgi:hypothetical protein
MKALDETNSIMNAGKDKSMPIIGERINSSRKAIAQAVASADRAFIQREAMGFIKAYRQGRLYPVTRSGSIIFPGY